VNNNHAVSIQARTCSSALFCAAARRLCRWRSILARHDAIGLAYRRSCSFVGWAEIQTSGRGVYAAMARSYTLFSRSCASW
jgi:hypothetical protein